MGSGTGSPGRAIAPADALQRFKDLERAEPQGRIGQVILCSLAPHGSAVFKLPPIPGAQLSLCWWLQLLGVCRVPGLGDPLFPDVLI